MKHYSLSVSIILMMAFLCGTGSKSFSQDWHTTGNTNTKQGNNFIGTIDSQGLSFKTNNILRMRLSAAGNIGMGLINPLQKLDVNGNINIGTGFSLFMENHPILKSDSAYGNIFLGIGSGYRNNGSYNTANGFQALYQNSVGSENTATGYQALSSNYAGYYNTANGSLALNLNSTGSYNTAMGNAAMLLNSTGSYNNAMGYDALFSNRGNHNNAFGVYALSYNTSGTSNCAFGNYALYKSSTGNYNVAMGSEALYANTAGYNTATGYRSLYANTTGSDNTANGWEASYYNTTGHDNTSVGLAALYTNTYGNYNTAVGAYALYNTPYSSDNTAIGEIAGASFYNGWNNTFVGSWADATGADIYNSIAIGHNSRVSASNQVRIGNSYTTSIGGYSGWSTISDERVKKNIKDNVPGLAFINKLKAVTYNLDLEVADKFLKTPEVKDKNGKALPVPETDMTARKSKEQVVYTGFLAQQVEKAAKELNYNFSGVDAAKNDKDLYSLRYAEFVVPLVKAVQELSNMNDKKDEKINELEERIKKLESFMPSNAKSGTTPITSTGTNLSQNIPNPFVGSTTINYSLPEKYATAQIIITDKNGKTVKAVNVSGTGKSSMNINATGLAAGTYQYSLLVDGKIMSSKQMVLAK